MAAEGGRVDDMRLGDLLQVTAIERWSYRRPWSLGGFVAEFRHRHGRRLVVVDAPGRTVLAYLVLWLVGGELHVSNVAVHPRHRRHGLGERLVRAALASGAAAGADQAFLEVRPSNAVALRLYRRLGFEVVGRRERYYTDNGEDALVLRLPLPARPAAAGQGQLE